VTLIGIVEDDDLTRHGEILMYLWNTDPATLRSIPGAQAGATPFKNAERLGCVHVADDTYRAARSRILADFVRRERLYLTAHAQQEWDEPAGANLSRELHRLA